MRKNVIKTVIMGIIMIMILSFGNTVLGTEIEKINLDYENLTMNVGETALILYTVEPSGANNVGNRTWLSHNPEIVEVDENGKITAKKEGIAQIELVINASKESGETYSATSKCEITVKNVGNNKTVTEDVKDEQVELISELPDATTYNVTETMIEKKEMSPQTKLITLVIIIGLIVIFILIGTASDKKEGNLEKRRAEKQLDKKTTKQSKEIQKEEKKEPKEVKEQVAKEEAKKNVVEKKEMKKDTTKTEKKTTNTKTTSTPKTTKAPKTTNKSTTKTTVKSTTEKTSKAKKDSKKGEKVKNDKKEN